MTGTDYNPSVGALLAYEPQSLQLLFSSATLPSDALGNGPKLSNPAVVNGHVYVPTRSSGVAVYGLSGHLAFVSEPPAQAVAGAPFSVTVEIQDGSGKLISSGAPISISSSPGGVTGTLTVNAAGGMATFSNLMLTAPGSYTLTASARAAGFQSATSTAVNVSPISQSQTITFGPIATVTRNARPFVVHVSASSGLTPLLTTQSDSCRVNGMVVTVVAAGSCSLTATQPGNAQYSAAVPVTLTFTVKYVPAIGRVPPLSPLR